MLPEELLRRYPVETIRWLRARRKKSQERFAELCDVQPVTVKAWEGGKHAVSPEARARIAPLLARELNTPQGVDWLRQLIRRDELAG